MRAAALGCAGILLGALDFGFMTLAGPAIDRGLDLGAAYPWLFAASSLAYGATLMPAGSLVERLGAGAVFRAGLVLYAGGLAVTALAPAVGVLLAGRALLGAGGGALIPAALALLAGVEVRSGRRLAFAGSGGAVATGFVGGVLLGAFAAPGIGWRWALLALCPPVLLLAPLARGVGRRAAPAAARPAGALAIAASAVATAAGLSVVGHAPFACAAALAVAAVLAGVGLRRAARSPGGWLPARARRRGLAAGVAAGAATTASGVGGAALLGRALPGAAELSPAATGLVLATFGLAVPVAVPAARALGGALGAAGCCGAGLAIQAAALGGLAVIPLTAPGAVAAGVALFGAGHVTANAGAAQAVMDTATGRPGPLGGLLATAQYAGAGAGALIVLAAAGGDAPTAAGVRDGLLVAAAIGSAGVIALCMQRMRTDIIAGWRTCRSEGSPTTSIDA
jgi:DHA2 family methylenomycin A resistance protein-like MFS transporter